LAATDKATEPLPLPELPPVTMIHAALEALVHKQPVIAAT
jgi:hypothetical protein